MTGESLTGDLGYMKVNVSDKQSFPGNLTISQRLTTTFFAFIVVTGISLYSVYEATVPPLVNEQVNMRMTALANTFAAAIETSVLTKDYLRVNQTAQIAAQQSGIAYVLVINEDGFPIAAVSSPYAHETFDADFSSLVKTEGYPPELLNYVSVVASIRQDDPSVQLFHDVQRGGRSVRDLIIPLNTSAEISIVLGIFVDDIEESLNKTVLPLLLLLAAAGILGLIALGLIGKAVSSPINSLSKKARQLAKGDLDSPIQVTGGRDIRELAQALEAFRQSALSSEALKAQQQ